MKETKSEMKADEESRNRKFEEIKASQVSQDQLEAMQAIQDSKLEEIKAYQISKDQFEVEQMKLSQEQNFDDDWWTEKRYRNPDRRKKSRSVEWRKLYRTYRGKLINYSKCH